MTVSRYTIWRRPMVLAETGYSTSRLYEDIADGTFPSPIRLGARARGFVASEVEQVMAARIAGLPDDAIRGLVRELEHGRKAVLAQAS